jgi:hypothetical protein
LISGNSISSMFFSHVSLVVPFLSLNISALIHITICQL